MGVTPGGVRGVATPHIMSCGGCQCIATPPRIWRNLTARTEYFANMYCLSALAVKLTQSSANDILILWTPRGRPLKTWLKQSNESIVNTDHCLLYIVYKRQRTDTVTRLLLMQFNWPDRWRGQQSQLTVPRLLAQWWWWWWPLGHIHPRRHAAWQGIYQWLGDMTTTTDQSWLRLRVNRPRNRQLKTLAGIVQRRPTSLVGGVR